MTLKDRTEDVMKMLDEETTRSNKELLIAAAVSYTHLRAHETVY